MTKQNVTRETHAALMHDVDALEDLLKAASPERLVEIGSILWDVGNRVNHLLEGIKRRLREVAIKRTEGSAGLVILAGDDRGEVSVTIPEAVLKVPKGTRLEEIRSLLGGDFDLFFEETVTFKPRKDFEERVLNVDNPLHQGILHNSVERAEDTPRVSFRRHRLSR
jgi:hypothetical protein